MSDAPVREWRFYLDDMIGFAEKVIVYTDGLGQEQGSPDGMQWNPGLCGT